MNIGFKQFGLLAALALAALIGACGPATPNPDNPSDKGAETGGTGTPTPTSSAATPAPSGTPEAAPTSAPAGSSAAAATPPAPIGAAKNVPVVESKMLEDLKKAGVAIDKIGDLEKLPLAAKKKVMPLMQKALGYEACTGCHVEGDYKKDTRNMKISREMWRAYSVALRDEKGKAVFCDNCHSGQAKVLNRADKEALKQFMEDEYEHKFFLPGKKAAECSTCHGDAMELKVIEKMWKIAPEAKK